MDSLRSCCHKVFTFYGYFWMFNKNFYFKYGTLIFLTSHTYSYVLPISSLNFCLTNDKSDSFHVLLFLFFLLILIPSVPCCSSYSCISITLGVSFSSVSLFFLLNFFVTDFEGFTRLSMFK